MRIRQTSLAEQLLELYASGRTVAALCAFTGLKEESVITRLCAASRLKRPIKLQSHYEDGSLGVQWRFVCWRA